MTMAGTARKRTRTGRLGTLIVAAVLAAIVAALAAAPAGAIVTETPGGKTLSYMPVTGPDVEGASPFAANGILDYNGGPVMPRMNQYAIFWAPTGFSFPAGYKEAVVKYMQDLAADSGKATNTTSVGVQYTDSTGARANYDVSLAGALDDTTSYPASGCPLYTPIAGAAFTKCLTDGQVRTELTSFISSHSLPKGVTNLYFVFLPDSVGSCFSPSGTGGCFDKKEKGSFCAYHSATTTNPTTAAIYANQSFTPRDPAGCGSHNYPNDPTATGGVDDQLSSLSHEANEAREDPIPPSGWYNNDTHAEGADQCRNTPSEYGRLLGGTFGVDGYNQVINGAHYILQQDWSNAHGCEQRYRLSARPTGRRSAHPGESLTFSAGAFDADGGNVTGVAWSFGDGATATADTAAHAYSAVGTYHTTVYLTNDLGLATAVAGPTVKVLPPNDFSFGRVKLSKKKGTAKLPVTVPGPGNLSLAGKGLKPIPKAKSRKAVAAGTTKLRVKAKGKAARKLKSKGKLKVTAKVTFTPTGGTSNTQRKKITLKRKL